MGSGSAQQAGWSRPKKVIPSHEPLPGIKWPPLMDAEGTGLGSQLLEWESWLLQPPAVPQFPHLYSENNSPQPTWASQWHSGKEPTCQCKRPVFHPWVRKMPWGREWLPTPTPGFLPGESAGQRSLAGCSPWGRKKLDMTWWINNNKSAPIDLLGVHTFKELRPGPDSLRVQ